MSRPGWIPSPDLQRAWSMSEWQTFQQSIRDWQQARRDAPGTESSGNFGNQPATEWNTGVSLTVASDTAADIQAMNLELDTPEGKRTLAKRVGAAKRRRVEVSEDARNQIETVQFTGGKPKGYRTTSVTDNLNRRIVRESLESSILMMLRKPIARRTEARGNRWIESLVNLEMLGQDKKVINVLQGLTVGPSLKSEFEGSKIIVKAVLIKLKFYHLGVSEDRVESLFARDIRIRIYQTSLNGFRVPNITDGTVSLGFIEPDEQEFFSLIEQRNVELIVNQDAGAKTGRSKMRTLELYINKGMRPVEVASGEGITDYTPISGDIGILISRDGLSTFGDTGLIRIKGWVKTFYQCEEIYTNN